MHKFYHVLDGKSVRWVISKWPKWDDMHQAPAEHAEITFAFAGWFSKNHWQLPSVLRSHDPKEAMDRIIESVDNPHAALFLSIYRTEILNDIGENK